MIEDYKSYFENAAAASKKTTDASIVNEVLLDLADTITRQSDYILAENKKDLDNMEISDPRYDRLKLTRERIEDIAVELRNVTNLESSLGNVVSQKIMPNGLDIKKIRVPLGVVGVIYEARPNVTTDVFALCFKTGNVCILKGGSDASHSNNAIVYIIHAVLMKHQVDVNVATLLPADREATNALLNAVGYVDVLIPRGSRSLIDHVRNNAKVPVIETGAGIVHTYFDETGDLQKASQIVLNAKTRRVSVCNALDCLIIHKNRLLDLPALVKPLSQKHVELYADDRTYAALEHEYPESLLFAAKPTDFGKEFLSLKMAVKTVDSFEEALGHIDQYSSKHSEAIISEDRDLIESFLNRVDAAAVYVNASTAFTDGAQFGLGSEIGISTQKLHARGPMGLEELTTYKWIVKGEGHIRY